MNQLLIVLIIFAANQTFRILPFHFQHIQGLYSVIDIGLAIILLMLTKQLLITPPNKATLHKLNNVFTWLMLTYVFIILLNIGRATLNYDQSITSGILKARHHFYPISLIAFTLVLDTPEKCQKTMKVLTVLSTVLISTYLIHYFGPDILYIAKEVQIRSGVERIQVPGIDLILATGLWHLTRWTHKKRLAFSSALFFIVTYGVVVLAQTRGRIIALSMTVIIVLLAHRRFKVLAGILLVFAFCSLLLNFILPENFLLSSFTSGFQETTTEHGVVRPPAWEGRLAQMKDSWEAIKEDFLFGNGAVVLKEIRSKETYMEAYASDVGYLHFFKFFGLVGFLWLATLIFSFYTKYWKSLRTQHVDREMLHFLGAIFTYIVIAEVTLDFFMHAHRNVILCLILAMFLTSIYPGRTVQGSLPIKKP